MFLRAVYRLQRYSTTPVYINGKAYNAIIADTFLKRAIGLMFRKSMGKNTCMLFVSKKDGRQSLTMHNMLFSIDVLWLDHRLKIVDMAEGIAPDRGFSFRTYSPKSRARYVLEFVSGSIRKNKISRKAEIKIRKGIENK